MQPRGAESGVIVTQRVVAGLFPDSAALGESQILRCAQNDKGALHPGCAVFVC